MSAEIEAYIERLDYLRNEIAETIRGMSAEELNWTPLAADTNSPTVLATHVAGGESYWLHQVIGGIDVHRDRDAEFVAEAAASAELETLLERTGQTSRQVLRGLSTDDLDETSAPRPGGDPVSTRYAILHQIDHLAQHLGHLTITRQLYSARKK